MNFIKKYKYEFLTGLTIAFFVLLFLLAKDQFGILSNREMFQVWIQKFGILAPLVIILVIVAEVVIAPIPGLVPSISAGFIFGTFLGAIYTFIGNILGTILLFYITRRFGRYLVLKFIEEHQLDKYERMIEKRKNFLFALYFFPIFPLDVITAAFGLSEIKFKKFISLVMIGYAFHVLLVTYFGDFLAQLYF